MKKLAIFALCAALAFAACGSALGEGDIVIPDVTVKQFDIPDSEAMAFLRSMGFGWNLGNTMDAYDDLYSGDDLNLESRWCGVKTRACSRR